MKNTSKRKNTVDSLVNRLNLKITKNKKKIKSKMRITISILKMNN